MTFETKRFRLTQADLHRWAWKNAALEGQWITAAAHIPLSAVFFWLFWPDGPWAATFAATFYLILRIMNPCGAAKRCVAALRRMHEVPGFEGSIKVEDGHLETWRDGLKVAELSFAWLDKVRNLGDGVLLSSRSIGSVCIPATALPEKVKFEDLIDFFRSIEPKRPGVSFFRRSPQ